MSGIRTISDLAELGPGWAICFCGHRGSLNLPAIARRYPRASIGAVRRSLRCAWCRHKTTPWVGVTIREMTAYQREARAREALHASFHRDESRAPPQKRTDVIGLAFAINAARALKAADARTIPAPERARRALRGEGEPS